MESKAVAGKILKVMAAIKSVTKDGFNAFHKYKYVTDAAIVAEIREHMIANGLICVPSQSSISVNGELTTLAIQYRLIDVESGESIDSQVYGYGQDKGDKGVYKAATGGEKYFLLKTFLLPTDDDPENEKEGESDELVDTGVRVPAGYWDLPPNERQARLGEGNVAKKTAKGWFIFSQKKKVEAFEKEMSSKPTGNDLISHDEQLELFRLIKVKNVDPEAFKAFLKDDLKVAGTNKITKALYDKVTEWVIRNERNAQ